jgi:hypothetical protein
LCKLLKKLPDDPDIENMDLVVRAWIYHNWIEDYNDEYKLLENQGYLIGSFTNPEMVRKILDKDKNTITSSDEDFDKLSKEIVDANRTALDKKDKRKRKRKIQE